MDSPSPEHRCPWRDTQSASIDLKKLPEFLTWHRLGRRIAGRLWGVMPQKKVRFEQFELDYGRFQLSRGGTLVRLEALPLQLLMLLIDSPNSLVTREQIAEKLWGKELFVDIEQGINTAVRKIRIALDDHYVQPRFLRTVVGKGYCFVAQITVEQEPSESEQVMFSAEELGRAVMAAAGLDPNNPRGSREG
jgi:DNA-binding winged helix-turn-helix (wHTH) protein